MDLLWDYRYVVSGLEHSLPAKLTNIVEQLIYKGKKYLFMESGEVNWEFLNNVAPNEDMRFLRCFLIQFIFNSSFNNSLFKQLESVKFKTPLVAKSYKFMDVFFYFFTPTGNDLIYHFKCFIYFLNIYYLYREWCFIIYIRSKLRWLQAVTVACI